MDKMSSRDYEIAMRLKKRLSEFVQIIELIVFGSRARGDPDEYSDMDVFVKVAYLDNEIKERISDVVWEVGFESFMFISPLICSKEEAENTPLRSAPIIKNIAEQGVSI
ncbi:nucleotidyltransferase domain-containing protein [bacterium]|nr:nucleotidyltransferase domain-containing protein [bacterium]MBU1781979.1 nucleotidyltransferase domain-containing protein [bacterium]